MPCLSYQDLLVSVWSQQWRGGVESVEEWTVGRSRRRRRRGNVPRASEQSRVEACLVPVLKRPLALAVTVRTWAPGSGAWGPSALESGGDAITTPRVPGRHWCTLLRCTAPTAMPQQNAGTLALERRSAHRSWGAGEDAGAVVRREGQDARGARRAAVAAWLGAGQAMPAGPAPEHAEQRKRTTSCLRCLGLDRPVCPSWQFPGGANQTSPGLFLYAAPPRGTMGGRRTYPRPATCGLRPRFASVDGTKRGRRTSPPRGLGSARRARRGPLKTHNGGMAGCMSYGCMGCMGSENRLHNAADARRHKSEPAQLTCPTPVPTTTPTAQCSPSPPATAHHGPWRTLHCMPPPAPAITPQQANTRQSVIHSSSPMQQL